jgi:hypothetical protein
VASKVYDFLEKIKSPLFYLGIKKTDIWNALELVKRLYFGRVDFQLDGDIQGFVENGFRQDEGPYLLDFGDDERTLVVVPGMHWEYDNTRDMQLTCNYSFNVEYSTRIRNYTSSKWGLKGDVVQSAIYELLGGIDPHAIVAAAAMAAGIKVKEKVYVVAHSQGSEIVRQALEFIRLMAQIPVDLQKLIFETTILQSTLQLLMSNAFPCSSYSYFRNISLDCLQGTGLSAAKALMVGEVKEKGLKKIHYQGFGSETYIHPMVYRLGSVRNARTHHDPIPDLGHLAKSIVANLSFHHPVEMAEKKLLLAAEQWEYVDTKVNSHSRSCLHNPLDYHGWLSNYWPNLNLPIKNDVPEKVSLLTDEDIEHLQKGDLAFVPCSAAPQGAACLGQNKIYPKKNEKKMEKEVAVAIFLDGPPSNGSLASNLYKLFLKSRESRSPEGRPPDSPVTMSAYLSLPNMTSKKDPKGMDVGKNATFIINEAFRFIVDSRKTFFQQCGQIPKIDIYGAGWGADVALELAWKLHKEKLKMAEPDLLAPDLLRVRFLGLFETIYSREMPENGKWHNITVAPGVDRVAQGLAGQETRTYFKPVILNAAPGSGLKISRLIFPGVQQDVIGNQQNEQPNGRSIMTLARDWMIREAFAAGVLYLNVEGIPKAMTSQEILNTPFYLKPGPMGFPDGVFNENPFKAQNPEEAIFHAAEKIKADPHFIEYGMHTCLHDMSIPEIREPARISLRSAQPKAQELFKDREFPAGSHWLIEKPELIASQ